VTPKLETKTTSDMRQAQQDFASTFAAFREANDNRLAALEAKSTVDPLLTEKVNKLNSALDEQTRRMENMTLATVGANFSGEAKSADNAAQKQAWASFIRTGETSALEGKSLASTDGEGGLIVPVETETRIDTVLAETSPMRRLATIRTIGASVFRKPISTSGAQAGWVGETDPRNETDAPNLELVDFPAGELYAMPAATQALCLPQRRLCWMIASPMWMHGWRKKSAMSSPRRKQRPSLMATA